MLNGYLDGGPDIRVAPPNFSEATTVLCGHRALGVLLCCDRVYMSLVVQKQYLKTAHGRLAISSGFELKDGVSCWSNTT